MNQSSPTTPQGAGAEQRRHDKFRIEPFAGSVLALWHDPELMGGYPLAYFVKENAGEEKAQSVADLLNQHAALTASHEQLVEALEKARNGLKWYRDNYHDADSQADDEMEQAIETALTQARLLSQPNA
jgi:hypothetical protein